MSNVFVANELDALRFEVDDLFTRERDGWVFPNDSNWAGTAGKNLTSTSFDGDSFSDVAKTVIDLSAEFSVPAGVRAILARVVCNDSGSAATASLFVGLSPNSDANDVVGAARPSGLTNDYVAEQTFICPCDANGDVYYQINASGASTMDVTIQIAGYCY